MAMTDASWSELHTDLLHLILQRFDNDLDLIRFRSVCSKWRHSSISNHNLIHTLPFTIQNPAIYNISFENSNSISKHTLLLIKPQQQEQQEQQETLSPWLISITKNSDGKTQFCHPLRRRSSYHFPYVLDFNKFSVVLLGNHFVMTNLQLSEEQVQFLHTLSKLEPQNFGYAKWIKIVSVTCHGEKPLALGTLIDNGRPVLFNFCTKESWTRAHIPHDISTYFQDICVFKKRFIAVNKAGRTVAIGPDYRVELVVEYVDGGDKKFLVESDGELLLVDIYDRHCFELNVFRLEENEKRWVKLTSLGDRVLFLGIECSFSASVEKGGNCVVFIDSAFLPFDNGMHSGECVFHLGEGRLSLLSENPLFLNMFGPPPEWIVKSCTDH